MYLIFVDESGYVKNWDSDTSIHEQPFYILSAVAIPTTQIDSVYTRIRQRIKELHLPHTSADQLGHGEEIKAKSIDKGEGHWGKDPELRTRVRDSYLNQEEATYFLVCVDKSRHKKNYSSPEDPSRLASRFLFERLQGFLEEQNAQGFVLVDKNKREEEQQQEYAAQLLTEGSGGIAFSKFYGTIYEWRLEFKNILEVHFGDSRHSLGLQIADFVARYAYSWRKAGKPSDYPGWSLILPRLYKYPNHVGWGYKEFPKEE
ncbi:MAG: DUF3800 domain-containing protein [Clostridiales bacterium]|uniref:DUF3800 domain-containing protein n=1 Tax=Hydrogenibacillus schlegelii TaxID=1484 RepID=UPI001ED5060E|nr:DUF3800 domain-containing protein [Hydrogenibacillus schlegelii]MBT9260253.1 DUF3800 domain-containing protein [Clostridiales bacterium]